MKGKLLIAILCAMANQALADDSIYDCPDGDTSLACSQQAQIEAIWVDMNQSANYVIDELMQDPESALEAGCLDNIRSIDLSIMTIDPTSIWTEIYAGLKDKLINQVCSAVEERANELTAMLETNLEAPYGLGSVKIQQSSSISSFSELTDSRVRLSDEEAKAEVVEKVFGEPLEPTPFRYTEKSMDEAFLIQNGVSTHAVREASEEKIESVLDQNRLWDAVTGDSDEDGN